VVLTTPLVIWGHGGKIEKIKIKINKWTKTLGVAKPPISQNGWLAGQRVTSKIFLFLTKLIKYNFFKI
jgi:hypothetical protein